MRSTPISLPAGAPEGGLPPRRKPQTWASGGLVALLALGAVACQSSGHSQPPFAEAPVFQLQPTDATVVAGSPATFRAAASGVPMADLVWERQTEGAWSPVSGATASTFTFVPVAADDGALFRAKATNSAGSVTSGTATLYYNAAPVLTAQPADQVVQVGGTATFSVTATAPAHGSLAYQWRRNGQDIEGATAATLSLPCDQAAPPVQVACVVRHLLNDTVTTTASAAATLRVEAAPAIARFTASSSHVTVGDAVTFSGAWTGLGALEGGGMTWVSLRPGDAPSWTPDAPGLYDFHFTTVNDLPSLAAHADLQIRVDAMPASAGFSADRVQVTAGDPVVLSAANVVGIPVIYPGALVPDAQGRVTVHPAVDTTYVLKVRNEAGREAPTRQVSVHAVPVPQAITFQAIPARIHPGDLAKLSVDFVQAPGTTASIVTPSGTSAVPVPGVYTVAPEQSTEYTLQVTNATGATTTRTAQVKVIPYPSIDGFGAAPTQVTAGMSTALTAEFSGGRGRIYPGDLSVNSGDSLQVTPTADTTYTLVVTDDLGATTIREMPVTLGRNSLRILADGVYQTNAVGYVPLPMPATVTGPNGYQNTVVGSDGQELRLSGLADGEYVVTYATVTDPTAPGLGRAGDGELGPEFLQRYPKRPVQRVTLDGEHSELATYTEYPAAAFAEEKPLTYYQGNFSFGTRTVRFDWILVPAGSFRMGSPSPVDNAPGAIQASPIHEVRFDKAFYVSKYPLTVDQYNVLKGNLGAVNPMTMPVELNWDEAAQVLGNNAANFPVRMLSEAEWEYVARAGTTTEWLFGDVPDLLGDYAWYADNSSYVVHPVGGNKPNGWGLFDMIGNTRSWVGDFVHGDYTNAPVDGSFWGSYPGMLSSDPDPFPDFRMVRGGDYLTGVTESRSGFRTSAPKASAHGVRYTPIYNP